MTDVIVTAGSRSPRTTLWSQLTLPVVVTMLGVLIVVITPAQVLDSDTDPVGPRFLPYLAGAAIIIGGTVDIIMQLVKRTQYVSVADEEKDESSVEGARRGAEMASYALILVGIVVWVYTTAVLGYAVSSLILMALSGLAFGMRKPIKMLVLIIITVGITYYVFAELLQVQLPLIGW